MRNRTKFNQGKYAGLTPAEIKQQWSDNGERSRNEGTAVHAVIESDMNGYDIVHNSYSKFKVIAQYLDFKHEHIVAASLIPFRSELRLRSSIRELLVGTADALYIAADHPPPNECDGVLTLHMIDWKTSKEIKKGNPYRNGTGPCSVLPDCNFSSYSLQQNTYKWLIESFYNNWRYNGHVYTTVRVATMRLAVFHDSRDDYEVIVVPELKHVIDDMLRLRHNHVRSLGESAALDV